MRPYGTKSPWYEDRKAERTCAGERPAEKRKNKEKHRTARKRARRQDRELAKE